MEKIQKKIITDNNEKEAMAESDHHEEDDLGSKEEEFNFELSNEKFDNIIKYLESINVEKEIGEKEKNKDSRIVIEKIELENFKSWAGIKRIYPLHYVIIIFSKINNSINFKRYLNKIQN